MFKQILFLYVSVLLLAMFGCTRSEESREKKTADAAVRMLRRKLKRSRKKQTLR